MCAFWKCWAKSSALALFCCFQRDYHYIEMAIAAREIQQLCVWTAMISNCTFHWMKGSTKAVEKLKGRHTAAASSWMHLFKSACAHGWVQVLLHASSHTKNLRGIHTKAITEPLCRWKKERRGLIKAVSFSTYSISFSYFSLFHNNTMPFSYDEPQC